MPEQMNRRGMFQLLAGASAAAGVTTSATLIEAKQAKPTAIAVFESPGPISSDMAVRIRDHRQHLTAGSEFEGVKAIVLGDGMTLKFVSPDGSIHATRVEPITVTIDGKEIVNSVVERTRRVFNASRKGKV